MEYSAHYRYADMSARKIRPFADLVRNRSTDEALELLRYVPNKGARLLEKTIRSAMGNAEHRGERYVDELIIVDSRVDGGPMLKRIQPRARGSAFPIKKRFSHIHVTLSNLEEEES